MKLQDKVREVVSRSSELGREMEATLLVSLQTELAVVRTMCTLAHNEIGEDRSHHVKQAETAYETVLVLAKRVKPTQQDRNAMEECGREITLLGGRKFSQQHVKRRINSRF